MVVSGDRTSYQEVEMARSVGRMQPRFDRIGRFGAGFVGLLFAASACSLATESGKISTETRQVTGFSRIELVGAS